MSLSVRKARDASDAAEAEEYKYRCWFGAMQIRSYVLRPSKIKNE